MFSNTVDISDSGLAFLIIRWIPILGIIIYLALFGASIYFLYRF